MMALNSRPVWAWSPGSSDPWVCAWMGLDGALVSCEEVSPLVGRSVEWPLRCRVCGEHALLYALLKINDKYETKLLKVKTVQNSIRNRDSFNNTDNFKT